MTKDEAIELYKTTLRRINDAGFVLTRGYGVMSHEERAQRIAQVDAENESMALRLRSRSA
jgi:hypothetical protein